MVVAVVALSFALVGSAVAGTESLKKAVTKSKVRQIAKKQANKRINKRESSLNVNSAKSAGVANIGLSPVAYAFVNADGTVDAAQSRGVSSANITLESTSAYCFRGLGFAFKTAMTTPAYFPPGTNGEDETVQVRVDAAPDCAGGAQLEVATVTDSAFAPEAFWIWFFN
jgi:hypothetical protein